MRIVMLASIALLSAPSAKADVFIDAGSPIAFNYSESFASLVYQFSPVSIPGTITSITATYIGSVVPGLYLTGLYIVSDLTLTPYASVANVSGSTYGRGYSNFYAPSTTAYSAGAPQTIPADRFGAELVTGFTASPITATSDIAVSPENLTALATGPIVLEVDGYSMITGRTYIPGAVGNLNVLADNSSVNSGRLTLAITYSPLTSVPEPISLVVLGGGLLGLAGLRRLNRTDTASQTSTLN